MRSFLAGAIAAAAIGLSAAAHAVTVDLEQIGQVWGTLTVEAVPAGTVPQANPIADAVTGAVLENTTGSIAGLKRSPFEGIAGIDIDDAGSVYTSVGGGASATYNVRGTSLSFIWGSVDSYNTLEFGGADLAFQAGFDLDVLFDIVGTEVQAPPTGLGAVLVTITTVGIFDSVTFSSGSNAFEFANVNVAPIPLPASALLLLGALGGFGLIARKRARAAA